MLKIQINREKIQEHFHYDWWKYLLSFIIILVFWNLYFTITRPQTPDHLKVDAYFVGPYAQDELLAQMGEEALKDFPGQKEINFLSLTITGEQDYAGWQRLTVYMGAQQGDIFVMEKDLFEKFAKEGAFLPLDDYIKNKQIDIDSELSLESTTFALDEENVPHTYGIPIDSLEGLLKTGYDPKNKVIGITIFSKNQENAVALIDWLLKNQKQ